MNENIIEYLMNRHPKYEKVIFSLRQRLLSKIYMTGGYFAGKDKSLFFQKIIFVGFICKIFLFIIYKQRFFNEVKEKYRYKGLSWTYFNYDELWTNSKNRIDRFFVFPVKKAKNIPWNFKLFVTFVKLEYELKFRNFNYLSSPLFFDTVINYQEKIYKYLDEHNYDYFLMPNDLDFHSRLIITYAEKRNKPTFVIAHGGLPNLYDGVMDNLTTYVSMWGRKQVDGYLANSYPAKKFFTTGHPFYDQINVDLEFTLDNILVLTKSMNGVSPLKNIKIDDPGLCIQYLLSIQNVLSSIGIKKARLRAHPSENAEWYKKFIDTDFFEFDYLDLKSSIASATLVIGPISTVFIDAIVNNKNYTVYEPVIDGKTIYGYPIQPPLDGIDERIPVARSEFDLKCILVNGRSINPSVVSEFVGTRFDRDSLFRILEKHDWAIK